jgi:DNA end-binding protein Ku
MIEAKVQGQEIIKTVQPQTGKVIDLMEALRASIQLAEEKNDKTAKADKPDTIKKRNRQKVANENLDNKDTSGPTRKRKSKELAAK